jgi:photosystem II PsbH protein
LAGQFDRSVGEDKGIFLLSSQLSLSSSELSMQVRKFSSKKVAPLQYYLKRFNSEAGKVTAGWGTTPLMFGLMLLFFVFLLMILQIVNSSIVVEGVDVNWSSLGQ